MIMKELIVKLHVFLNTDRITAYEGHTIYDPFKIATIKHPVSSAYLKRVHSKQE